MSVTETMSELVLQLGIIIFAVRCGGRLVKLAGIPSVLGELLAGILIGPYALGGIAFPGFPQGLFPLGEGMGGLAVSAELYAFATLASIILLFSSGLETDLGLFLRYSLVGGVVGIGGVVFSFTLGALTGVFLLNTGFFDPRCLFLGILSTATSVGITARILSDQKRMDSPEGVTILAAAVFDDVLGIIALAVILGIVALITGGGGSLNAASILGIAGKAMGIWLSFTVLGLIFSKKIAAFLKLFKSTYDFSVLALGVALILAGFFEKQGLAMIIGAYTAGLSLSKTDIAAIIQERIHGLYEFFVPVFFAVMGMMVNLKEIFSPPVLIFGGIYTLVAIASKVIGCGGPALFLGFNLRGSLRIGAGMIPRGEVALIIAGIGMSSGILDNRLFGVVILMTLVTTLTAPPLLSASLKLSGDGTRKPAKSNNSAVAEWEFYSDEIADLVVDILLKDLKDEGFYVQMMNIDEGLSQARKDDISLSITESESVVTIETSTMDMPFVKTAVFEVMLQLNETIQKLKDSSNPQTMQQGLLDTGGRTSEDLLSLIHAECISLRLQGNTKEEILSEMIDILGDSGKLENRALVLEDVLEREHIMSTGMQKGVALPHAKSDGVQEICVAVGIKKSGVDFESMDGNPSQFFVMILAPRKSSGPHLQLLAAVAAVLQNDETRQKLIEAESRPQIVALLTKKH
ncbi:sodium:proton antiporter [Spirochaetia bacterium]|nr:sodium:proton antiporter [Spirochaetia bacterium]